METINFDEASPAPGGAGPEKEKKQKRKKKVILAGLIFAAFIFWGSTTLQNLFEEIIAVFQTSINQQM